MLSKLKKSNGEGFTIIEVMIVLAIAGLILLIVFLAVPALQRTSRNTQRKNDAANIASTIGTFISNNNGTLPNGFGGNTSGQIDDCAAGGVTTGAVGTTACGAGNTESGKIGYYDGTTVYVNNAATAASIQTPTTVAVGAGESTTKVSTATLIVVKKEACPNTSGGAATYNARGAAVFYVTESNNGNGSLQCVSS